MRTRDEDKTRELVRYDVSDKEAKVHDVITIYEEVEITPEHHSSCLPHHEKENPADCSSIYTPSERKPIDRLQQLKPFIAGYRIYASCYT
jgi:hypothetical protein